MSSRNSKLKTYKIHGVLQNEILERTRRGRTHLKISLSKATFHAKLSSEVLNCVAPQNLSGNHSKLNFWKQICSINNFAIKNSKIANRVKKEQAKFRRNPSHAQQVLTASVGKFCANEVIHNTTAHMAGLRQQGCETFGHAIHTLVGWQDTTIATHPSGKKCLLKSSIRWATLSSHRWREET